ncbi:MAG: c-type cytochrome [Nitrospinae bacterium]|nr:c-type cytochrome [Nitrospinota bacterium]MBI3814306.1 c-type cytochrome [Nitrospinota bacterium]
MLNTIIVLALIVNLAALIIFWRKDQNNVYAVFIITIVFLFGATVYKDSEPEWKKYQREYKKLLIEKTKDPKKKKSIEAAPIEVKQLWNQGLDVADRCITCHLGYDTPEFADAPLPYKYHAKAREHDFNKVGCTICHEGQGRATEKVDAHARGIPHWDNPLLPVNMVQSTCGKCHSEIHEEGKELKGADMLNLAKKLSVTNKLEVPCITCHAIKGVGEILAPDLSEFGSRTEHEFELSHDLTHIEGEKNMYNWTYQHFLDPQKVTPGSPATATTPASEPTIMPNFDFTPDEANALTVFVMGLKEDKIPGKYKYKPRAEPKPKAISRFQEAISHEEFEKLPFGEQIFIHYNCWYCHTLKGRGGKIAPDLTHVGGRRDRDWLIKHFKDPGSVSPHTFMPTFRLTDEQIDALTDFLASLK